MGGAVAIHVAAERVLPSLVGIVVVDVVEGTHSLISQHCLLNKAVYDVPYQVSVRCRQIHVRIACLFLNVLGTALEGLSVMQSFLKGRPKSFSSMEKAIEWRLGQLARPFSFYFINQ